MKEYITKQYYEKDGLIIGTNGKSYLIGQHTEWVIVDKHDLRFIKKVLKDEALAGGMNESLVVRTNKKGELVLSQQNNTIRINKNLFSRTCT
jgi:hypothetical protein